MPWIHPNQILEVPGAILKIKWLRTASNFDLCPLNHGYLSQYSLFWNRFFLRVKLVSITVLSGGPPGFWGYVLKF